MRYLILAACLTIACTAQSSAQGSGTPGIALPPDQIVAMRKAMMDLQGGNLAAMKAGVEQKAEVKPFSDGAKALVASGKLIPAMFPAGTEKVGDTKAKPGVWSNTTDFAKDAQALVDASEKLVTLADANDKAGFADQFATVGKTCGACHREYKERN